jgi:hypothetical protein
MKKGLIWRTLLILLYWCSAFVLSLVVGGYILVHAGWWMLLVVIPLVFLLHGLFASVTVSLTARKGK